MYRTINETFHYSLLLANDHTNSTDRILRIAICIDIWEKSNLIYSKVILRKFGYISTPVFQFSRALRTLRFMTCSLRYSPDKLTQIRYFIRSDDRVSDPVAKSNRC